MLVKYDDDSIYSTKVSSRKAMVSGRTVSLIRYSTTINYYCSVLRRYVMLNSELRSIIALLLSISNRRGGSPCAMRLGTAKTIWASSIIGSHFLWANSGIRPDLAYSSGTQYLEKASQPKNIWNLILLP